MALEGHELLECWKVVIAVEVGQREAESIPTPLDPGSEFEPVRIVPRLRRSIRARNPDPEDPVVEGRGRNIASPWDRVGLPAGAQVGRLHLVEVHREFEPNILERTHVVERVDEARRVRRDTRLLETRKRGQAEVLRVELVGGAEQLRLAPDDLLEPEPHPEPIVEEAGLDVGLLQLLGVLLTRTAIPREIRLVEIDVEAVEVAVLVEADQTLARYVETLRVPALDVLREMARVRCGAQRKLAGSTGDANVGERHASRLNAERFLFGGPVGSRNDAGRHTRVVPTEGIGALVRVFVSGLLGQDHFCAIGEQERPGSLGSGNDEVRRKKLEQFLGKWIDFVVAAKEGIPSVRRFHGSRIHDRIRGVPADVPGVSTAGRRRQPPSEWIGLVAKRRVGVDRILRQPGAENGLLEDAPIRAAMCGRREDEVEVVGHRVTKGVVVGVGNVVGAFDVPNSPEVECAAVRNHRTICPTVAVERLDVIVGIVIGSRTRPEHARVVLGHPVAESIGKPLRAIPVGVGRAKHPTAALPDAVVTAFDTNVGLEQIDRAPAVGKNVDLHLEIDDVVPLGEIEIVVELFVEDADLHFRETVGLNAPVEEFQSFGTGGGEAQGDHRSGQSQQGSPLELRECLQRRHLRIGTRWPAEAATERWSEIPTPCLESARHLGVAEVFPPETHLGLLPCDDSDDNELSREIDHFRITVESRRSSPKSGSCGELGSEGARNAPERIRGQGKERDPRMGSGDAAKALAGGQCAAGSVAQRATQRRKANP